MSAHLIIVLVFAGMVALSAGIATSNVVHSGPGSVAGSGAAARRPASETEVRDYREKFFSGDPDRDIRGGQEMKPRW
ncbi:entry exclusion protein TrbK [Brucella intermedia]|uniref:entry exclusion protein TrbK n=1 Tax=Brucella intermedia TaxID=94625 RepID=UPI00124D2A2B|nr:entry exclusion protein TrbK [Brucella intermedia]KAB2692502.1 entry exclusion protein TrbK [Brucella intermedia]